MKKRRFADGGETDPDVEMANASDDPIAYMNKAKRWTDTEEAPAKPKVVTKEELAKSGLSLRDYMNKQQGLKRKATPYTGSGGSAGGRGPTAEEFAAAATPSKRARLESALDRGIANPKGYADPEFSPQAGGIATGALKGLSAAARGLMNRAAKPAAAEAQQALSAPVKRVGFDKAGAKAAERGARAEGRQAEMLKENARRSGLREDAPAETAKAVREKLGGKDWSLPMKKGGAVKKYAAGGAVKGWGQARGARAAKIV